MLDKSTIGEAEPLGPLKCEQCGMEKGGDEEDIDDRESIDETGMCFGCLEEYNNRMSGI